MVKILFSLILLLVTQFLLFEPALARDKYQSDREEMVDAIKRDAILTALSTGKPRFSKKVMQTMATVPRHEFVLPGMKMFAYQNRPLRIGYGQTISQPYIVALMTELLEVEPDDVILEIGTGSGYQAAVLAELSKNVYSIEIIEPLGKRAAKKLKALGYEHVHTRIGDGYYGWKESAPFDGIIVTAAASHIPPPLLEQLKPGGRMVIPVGSQFLTQHLLLVTKSKKGKIKTQQVLPVAFVPLTGEH